ncbi:uncharacterized protein LOC135686718 isoform X4 [Rhopilema esculentum]|uniref:uncharacterized protein LOC135686718 isoform X4 n=1 Tax=Rhopilema esculentum TaxID=499914 RepID=UPI0031D9D412
MYNHLRNGDMARKIMESEMFCQKQMRKIKASNDKYQAGIKEPNDESSHDTDGWKFQIEKLKIENMNAHLEKVSREKSEHIAGKNKHSALVAEMKKREFVKRKLQILAESKTQQKYVEHVTEKTSAMLLADIVKSSVHPLATKEEVWKELLKPLNGPVVREIDDIK